MVVTREMKSPTLVHCQKFQQDKKVTKILLSTKELTEVVYPCPVCRAIFYHDFELESHIKSEHEAGDGSENDSDSGEAEDANNPVTEMMKQVTNTARNSDDYESNDGGSTSAAPPVQQAGMTRCPICPSSLAMFSNVNDLQVHLTEIHGVQAKVVNLADKKGAENSLSKYGGHYECPVCALLFSSSADMYAHLNSTHMKHVRKTWKMPSRQLTANQKPKEQQGISDDDTGRLILTLN